MKKLGSEIISELEASTPFTAEPLSTCQNLVIRKLISDPIYKVLSYNVPVMTIPHVSNLPEEFGVGKGEFGTCDGTVDAA